MRSALGAPLWLKLSGANAIIIAITVLAARIAVHNGGDSPALVASLVGALAFGLAINVVLVIIALRPLRALEQTAAEVWRGNTDARVPYSPLADRDIARVGHTLNLLVEALVDDRTRARELARVVISEAKAEQLRIAHELRESAAQQLAAQVMQISAIARDTHDPNTRARLEALRDVSADTLEHLRALARDVSPRSPNDVLGGAATPYAEADSRVEHSSGRR
jgi:signal transduction histidine kinase